MAGGFVLINAWVRRVPSRARAVSVFVAAVVAASCGERSPLGPLAPGHARLSLAPRFATVAGAPAVPLSRIDGSLTRSGGEPISATANFVDGSASLSFDVPVFGESTDYVLELVGLDVGGRQAYSGQHTYTIKPGVNDNLEPPVLEYSAPDARATALHLTAGATTLDPGATTKITATGTDAANAPVAPIRVGWTSRNTSIATVDADGNIVASQLTGQTYIVARTPANLADSLLIRTRGAVAQVVATPASVSVLRGGTSTIATEVRDPSGTLISDRPPTFSTSDGNIATVTAAGVVSGVAVGSAKINVAVGDKTATVSVTVASSVAGIQLDAPTITLGNLGDVRQLVATLTAKAGGSVAGLTPAFTTSDGTVATVTADGRVTATGYGLATITATIESFTATSIVSVVGPLVIAPATPTIFTNATQQLTVTSGGKGPFTWSVNGVTGGNAALGQISASGSYKAPAQIPVPASFDICAVQASPATQGCTRVTLASPVAGIQLAPPTITLANLGDAQQLTATILAKQGGSVAGLTPTFTTSDGSVAVVTADGRVTATGYGTATITAAIESFSATSSIAVVGPLVLAPEAPSIFTTATQQFSVTAGGKGPFTWTVNGIAAGNETVGQISSTGLYRPPASAPNGPLSFDVCAAQALPATQGCTKITVTSPVAGIQLAPPTVTLAHIGDTQLLTATVLPKQGASVLGLAPTLTTSDATVATVSPDGRVTATGYGTATISATIESFSAATAVSVVGPLVLAPAAPTVFTNGATVPFSVTAGGNGPFTWTVNGIGGGNATVGTISGTGSYTSPAHVPATGASIDVCAVQVSPATQGCAKIALTSPVASVQLSPGTLTLANIGDPGQLSANITAKPGGSVGGLVAQFTSSDERVATVNANGGVTATGFGLATITASVDGVSGTASVAVVSALTVTPATVEKLPKGTQQFTVTSGGRGPFTWQVNDVTGGSAAYGTITPAGFYTAPDAVPQPASFDVCAIQDVPASRGCARVTINPVPSAGADVIVFNDMNLWDNNNGFAQGGANQGKFVVNLISFTGVGPRVSQNGFMFYRGHGSLCASSECSVTSNSRMSDTLRAHGYTVLDNSSATLTGPIDPTVKVFLILTPSVAFSSTEINILKQFAAEGGRIVYSGEHGGYYGSYVGPVENTFFSQMGAQLTNTAAVVACSGNFLVPQSSIRPHQVTTGLTGLSIPCASGINLGPNDYALVYDPPGTTIVGAVAKIDLTPLALNALSNQSLRANLSRSAAASPALSTRTPSVDGLNKPRPNP